MTSTRPALVRVLSTWDVVAIGVNGVIGGGIFLAPATVARLAGSWSTFVYLFSGGLVALIAFCFAEAGGRFGGSGGPFLYAEKAFGRLAGFEVGWFAWIARITSMASLANGLVAYAAYLLPAAGGGLLRLGLLALLMGGLTAVNLVGVRQGSRTINLLTVAKLAPLSLFILLGAWHVTPGNLVPGQVPSADAFADAALFMIFVFGGFEVLTFPAEEMIDPRRSIPRAILGTLAIVAVVYLGVHLVAMGTLGPDMASSKTPVASATERTLGPVGAIIITVVALLSICGTESGLMLTTPRLLYAMADHGHLPPYLCRVHPRFRTPYVAILVQGTLGLALAAVGTFEGLAKLSAIARIVTYAATCLAVPVFRRRETSPSAFTVRGGAAVPAAATLLCVWLVASSGAVHLMLGFAAALAGWAIYGLGRLAARMRPSNAVLP